jgi:hypothetical protein
VKPHAGERRQTQERKHSDTIHVSSKMNAVRYVWEKTLMGKRMVSSKIKEIFCSLT